MNKSRRDENPQAGLTVKAMCAAIQASPALRRPLKPHMPVIVKIGPAEAVGGIALLGVEQLGGGERSYAQLSLNEPMDMQCRMRFILLDKSGAEVVAEGKVLLIGLRKIKTAETGSLIHILDDLAGGDYASALHDLIGFFSPKGVSGSFLRKSLSLNTLELDGLLQRLTGIVEIKLKRDVIYMDETDSKQWADRIIRLIKEFHIAHPHQTGPDLAFIEEHLKPGPAKVVVREIITRLETGKLIAEQNGCFRMQEFSPLPDEPLEGVKGEAYRLYQEMAYSPEGLRYVAKTLKQPVKRLYGILRYLCEQGYLVRLDKETFVTKEIFKEAKDMALVMIKKQGDVELGQFRDRIGSSRRIAALLLERFDKKGWTERSGDKRTLGPKAAASGST